MATVVPIAYQNTSASTPDWLNKGDNAWQMISATLVGLPERAGSGNPVRQHREEEVGRELGLHGPLRLRSGGHLLGPALGQKFLIAQAALPATTHYHHNGTLETAMATPYYPMASMVWFQCVFAAITVILLAGSVLGRMNIKAWMMFVPLWLTFSYTVGAFSLWGGGFLFHWGVIDYSGGYVIHLSSGIAGLTAAYWVGPRSTDDRERFPPNNVLLTLAGAGLLWMGWAGFNGGDPYSANIDSSMAVLNTNICAATSLLVWTWLDVIFFDKPSVIGAVQGMITGLVCITPGAGLVQGWAAIIMGILSGSVPWFSMMIVHKRLPWLQKIDDTLGGIQFLKQIVGGGFVIGWNLVVTSIICVLIQFVIPLRMSDEQLRIGDDAVHGEEAYALWGDGEKYDSTKHGFYSDDTIHHKTSSGATQVV
ncbi:ammonium transporter 2 [Actinidia rufa]|uniref:Ammonium transporter 2 n=1 Tax=Actinidia rufa TaxID=165716 RepID=A0A7J0F599_9ERIC|nr:ammonium transporter 2 [Actinidia rufa]